MKRADMTPEQVERARAHGRASYARHREARQARARANYAANPAAQKARSKDWEARNRLKMNEYRRLYQNARRAAKRAAGLAEQARVG